MVRNKKVGVFGEVHPDVTENYGIDVDCYVAELDLDALFEASTTVKTYKPLPKFPAVTRDIALLCDDSSISC